MLPTLAHLSGASLPENLALDGFNISAVLLGEKEVHSPRTALYSLYGLKRNRLEAMRSGKWKLHLLNPPALYDLRADIAESANVSDQHQDVVAHLLEMARRTRVETGIPD